MSRDSLVIIIMGLWSSYSYIIMEKQFQLIEFRHIFSSGENVIYELAYNVLAMALLYYVIPYLMLATYAYRTHHSLRKSERPAGETKQDVMKDRSGS